MLQRDTKKNFPEAQNLFAGKDEQNPLTPQPQPGTQWRSPRGFGGFWARFQSSPTGNALTHPLPS